MKFRDYQSFTIDSIFNYFEEGNNGNPIVAMPTGTGKSVVIGGFIQEVYKRYPGQRIIKLTHVKELIEQNFEKLLALWPSAPAGIYSAGLNRKEVDYPITYAGIATAINVIEIFGHIDLIIIDECHLVSPKQGTMYQSFISGLKQINPYLKVIGFTATHYRLGQGMLTEEDGLFTDTCIDMTTMEAFNWFVDEGYLSPLIPRPTKVELDTDAVKIQGGEFNLKQLQQAVDKEEVTYAALQEALEFGQDRNHWLVFASGIEHAVHVASMLDSLGIPATFIHSKLKKKERDQRLLDYKAGKYRAMVNNGILTTGFDFPNMDLILMLRPTRSPGLWVQMLGRGTRPVYAPGFDLDTTQGRLNAIKEGPKQNCLVLDFAGNTRRLGPINDPMIPKRRRKGSKGMAPVKVCDNCGVYCHASVRTCPNCGYEFPIVTKLNTQASTNVLIAREEEPIVTVFNVDRVIYNKHEKTNKPTSLRVSYYCGLRKFDEWVCLEHEGYPGKKARDWWRSHSYYSKPPATVVEAIKQLDQLRTPIQIRVWINKKHPEIMGYEYESGKSKTEN